MVDVFGRRLLLPAPLDGAAGDFLILMSVWIVIAALAAYGLAWLGRRLPDRVAWFEDVIDVSTTPLFLVVVLVGIQSTFQLVAASADIAILVQAVDWMLKLTSLALLIVVLYWAYKIMDELLIHYAREFARQAGTTSSIQPLISLAQKLGLVVIIAVGAITGLATFGVDVTMLAATAGIGGLVIAFAAQDTLSNYFSGIFLLLDQPFKEGDWIELPDGEIARVEEVGLRSTTFYHKLEHTIINYPNAMIAEGKIVDLMEPDRRMRLQAQVGINYGGPVEDAMRILADAVSGHGNVITDHEDLSPMIVFDEFGDSSLNFRVFYWIDDLEQRWKIKSEVHEAIDKAFREADIEIPYSQHDVWFRNELETGTGEADAADA